MKEWMCNKVWGRSGFTKGKIYSTNNRGELIDDDGKVRIEPYTYNFNCPESFIELDVELENK